MSAYYPILSIGLLASLFAVGSVAASALIGPRRYNRAKLDSYECGIQPTPQPIGGGRVPVKYYIVAMLFIVFDIETVFMIPWAVAFRQLSSIAGLLIIEMFVFILILAVGYIKRFEPNFDLMKRLIDEGFLGKLDRFEFEYGSAGGWAPLSGYNLQREQAGGGSLPCSRFSASAGRSR